MNEGGGLMLMGETSRKQPGGSWLKAPPISLADEPWVLYRIPVTRDNIEAVPKLQRVWIRFGTDYDPPGEIDKTLYPPTGGAPHYREKWVTDNGGAIIMDLVVWDADQIVREFHDLNLQSPGTSVGRTEPKDITPEQPIHYGLGISVRVWFKNQFFVNKLCKPEGEGPWQPVADWDGKPWINKDKAEQVKAGFLMSVGAQFA